LGGRLGYGNVGSIGGNIEPASAGLVELGGRAVQLAAGDYHTCARLDDGAVRCWGLNFTGQLGYGHTEPVGDNEVPADLDPVNVGAQVVQLAAGSYHTCARLDGGGVRCWGGGDVGQLGYGNTEAIGDDEDPASQGLVDVGGLVVDLAAGGYSTCAVLQGGAIHCWGQSGALGYPNAGNIGDDEFPASVGPVQIGDAAIEVVVGRYHTCALLQGGAVRCWGSNYHGALGYPGLDTLGIDEHPDTVGPVEVGGPVTKLSAGYQHTCALLDGALRCWGYALYGRLGYGHLDFGDELHVGDDETPASVGDVPLGGIAIDVATGEAHTCALLDGGAVRCWGEGRYGRLGYATLDDIGDDETPSSVGDVPCLLP
jgi:alpha-tubulin suppressor-like RCC1 family protein